MSQGRGNPSGWAAFDLKQRQKRGTETEIQVDPYPPLPNLVFSDLRESSRVKNKASLRPFSSVVQSSINFKTQISNDDDVVGNLLPSLEKLKNQHIRAEGSLIEDILSAVNGDEEHASMLLRAMGFPKPEPFKMPLTEQGTGHEDQYGGTEVKHVRENISQEKQLAFGTHLQLISGKMFPAPVEPEWEEDDIYLIHRKDALKMMRSASQHSRAATGAYERGDHISAQQHSKMAHEAWLAAEELNAKAAKEILSLRNDKDDPWKLDLHGLHASEAISALRDHLQMIETKTPVNQSVVSCYGTHPNGVSSSPSMEFAKSEKHQPLPRQQQKVLLVITGIGSHSKEQAALPAAVRSFLTENRYFFDDARPGVFAVRPKFHNH